jgi:hypothetical protein
MPCAIAHSSAVEAFLAEAKAGTKPRLGANPHPQTRASSGAIDLWARRDREQATDLGYRGWHHGRDVS